MDEAAERRRREARRGIGLEIRGERVEKVYLSGEEGEETGGCGAKEAVGSEGAKRRNDRAQLCSAFLSSEAVLPSTTTSTQSIPHPPNFDRYATFRLCLMPRKRAESEKLTPTARDELELSEDKKLGLFKRDEKIMKKSRSHLYDLRAAS